MVRPLVNVVWNNLHSYEFILIIISSFSIHRMPTRSLRWKLNIHRLQRDGRSLRQGGDPPWRLEELCRRRHQQTAGSHSEDLRGACAHGAGREGVPTARQTGQERKQEGEQEKVCGIIQYITRFTLFY